MKEKITHEEACDIFVCICIEDAQEMTDKNIKTIRNAFKEYNVLLDHEKWFITVCTFIIIVTLYSRAIINIFSVETSEQLLDQLEKSLLKYSEIAWKDAELAETIVGMYKINCKIWNENVLEKPNLKYLTPISCLAESFIDMLNLDESDNLFSSNGQLAPQLDMLLCDYFRINTKKIWKNINHKFEID